MKLSGPPPASTVLPPAYKKSMYRGIAAWIVLAACFGAWVRTGSEAGLKDWNARIPQASAPVRAVYLTPQITETAHPDFSAPVVPGDTAIPAPQGASIALIMTDLGLSDAATARAVDDLPPAVALAISPYGNLSKWIKKAAEAGHEALALLPMEPDTYPKDDPGPRALLTRASSAENTRNLDGIMKDSAGAWGVMNFMGSAFLTDRENLSAVYTAMRKANLAFVENREDTQTAAAALAGENSLPYLGTDIRIDASATEADIGQKLVDLEKLARRQGYAIGLAEPYPVSFNVIKSWAENLDKRGVRLVPLSAVWKAKAGARTPLNASTGQQPPDELPGKK